MTEEFIPVNKPLITAEDVAHVSAAMEASWISGEGVFVKEFEEKFSEVVGRRHGISVSNGTVAIDLLIDALGIGPGDEVILPTFTIISCLSQILRAGAKPVFVDSDPETWNMNVDQAISLVSKKTKLIIAVHIYGLPVDMDRLVEFANNQGILLIEDAAEAHGLKYRERITGSFGVASTFSFYANKNITTGEGGIIVTDDDKLAERLRISKNLGFQPERRFVHSQNGWNARMSSLQAALGTSQINRLSEIVEKRKALGKIYSEAFAHLQSVTLPVSNTEYAENNYWVFGLVLNNSERFDARGAMSALEELGVGTRPFFYPLHLQPLLKNFGLENQPSHPVAENLGEMGFYIPNGLAMTDSEVSKVVDSVIKTID